MFVVVADEGLVTDDEGAGPAVTVVDVFAPTVAELAPTTNVFISIDGNNKCPAFCGKSIMANRLVSPSVAVK